RAAVKQILRWEKLLARPVASPKPKHRKGKLQFKANCRREEFEAGVESCKRYITAGDIFQVVYSMRLQGRLRADPFSVYRALRTVNPSPYMFFLKMGKNTVLGASPEMLVKVTGRVVDYRPIAGTRPRGANEAEDLVMERELRAD